MASKGGAQRHQLLTSMHVLEEWPDWPLDYYPGVVGS